jgi:hypothetical protein
MFFKDYFYLAFRSASACLAAAQFTDDPMNIALITVTTEQSAELQIIHIEPQVHDIRNATVVLLLIGSLNFAMLLNKDCLCASGI